MLSRTNPSNLLNAFVCLLIFLLHLTGVITFTSCSMFLLGLVVGLVIAYLDIFSQQAKTKMTQTKRNKHYE